jgi:glycerol-3-phosphate dehydrogenase (NAD(P)+)
MKTTIAIIGDGAMATVCSRILAENGCQVRLWSAFAENVAAMRATGENAKFLPGVRLPEGLTLTTDPAEAIAGADLAVSAVPCQYIRGVWARFRPLCDKRLRICSVAKGIENKTLWRPTQILSETLTGQAESDWPIAVLSGPSIAHEVACGQPATVVAASLDIQLAADVQRLFSTPYFRVYTNNDVIGVELAGATKNVIAIAAGILDGLAAGDNAKAALVTRGLVEITRLGVALGGKKETFTGLAGLGDLVTTCVSPHGRNRSLGQAIGQGKTLAQAQSATASVVEGVATTLSVVELAQKAGIEMPITEAVHAVLFQGQPPRRAIAKLMSRPPKPEA